MVIAESLKPDYSDLEVVKNPKVNRLEQDHGIQVSSDCNAPEPLRTESDATLFPIPLSSYKDEKIVKDINTVSPPANSQKHY